MVLTEAFKKYEKLMGNLRQALLEYTFYFDELHHQELVEQILQEKISDEEKREIEDRLVESELSINLLYMKLLNHVHIVTTLLHKETHITQNIINNLNKDHIATMQEYATVITLINRLKHRFPDYDFDMIIDFSKMDSQKRQLDIEIKRLNNTILAGFEQPLLNVKECQEEAKRIDNSL